MEPWTASVGQAAVFRGVAPEGVARLLASARLQHHPDQAVIFNRGDEAGYAYLIVKGHVRISSLGANAKRVVVEIFQEEDVFGELAVIDGGFRTADATAMGQVELVAFPAGPFRELVGESSAFAVNLLRIVTARLRRTYSLFEDASLLNLELRLAKQVLYLMRLGASGEKRVRIHARMHQDDLADLLGATSRSIINILNKWRAEGLATFDGRTAQLTILDLARFQALIGLEMPSPGNR